ncbi:MAG TPA: response regulator [Deltaproteobacteria bacterium]|nr:response regulator [Deltaproteobacteria bacterium]
MKHTLLIVDDEASILSSLVRLFRREDFRVLTATSGRNALKLLEENDVSLIISDYRMPETDGVELLSRAREISPDTIRIILTGYADLDAAVDAINKGEVYKFITKPWNNEELLQTVKRSLDYLDLMRANRRLTRTVKKQAHIIRKLEESHPGITNVVRTDDGSIVVNEEEFEGKTLDDILKEEG